VGVASVRAHKVGNTSQVQTLMTVCVPHCQAGLEFIPDDPSPEARSVNGALSKARRGHAQEVLKVGQKCGAWAGRPSFVLLC
jgi:hypothetical protein